MAKHNPQNVETFLHDMEGFESFDEDMLLQKVQPSIITVEVDDTYSTKQKLKIFEQFSMLTNCPTKERKKHVKKIGKLLR